MNEDVPKGDHLADIVNALGGGVIQAMQLNYGLSQDRELSLDRRAQQNVIEVVGVALSVNETGYPLGSPEGVPYKLGRLKLHIVADGSVLRSP